MTQGAVDAHRLLSLDVRQVLTILSWMSSISVVDPRRGVGCIMQSGPTKVLDCEMMENTAESITCDGSQLVNVFF